MGHTGQYIHALWIIWDSIPVSSGSCGTVICALWVMWDSTAAHCGSYGMVASCCFESSQLLEVTSGLCGTVQLCVVGHVGQYNDTLWIMLDSTAVCHVQHTLRQCGKTIGMTKIC